MFEMRPYHKKHDMTFFDPFREMENLEKRFFESPFGFAYEKSMGGFHTDISDNGNEYVLEADLPGCNKEDIHVDIDGDVLKIKAERHSEFEEKDKKDKFIRCERSYGSYSRQFDISGIDTEKISAKYENGILTLKMPKKEEMPDTSKRLKIE